MSNLMFVDANIFMYAAGKAHRYKQPCLKILDHIEFQKIQCVTNTEVIQELLHRYSEIGIPEKGIQLSHEILRLPISTLPISETDIGLALNLFEKYHPRGIKSRDAIHAANMKFHNIIQIISADKHFDHFDFLSRIDPQKLASKLK